MNKWDVSDKSAAILQDAVVCDMLVPSSPLQPDMGRGFPEFIDRMIDHGVNFASMTVYGDYPSIEDHFRWVARGRGYFHKRSDKFVLVDTADDILRAKTEGKLAVNFNFQGTNALFGELAMVESYRKLGVGHMLFAYNQRNLMADGCHERTDAGLSRAGVNLVKEMNRVGMIIDGTHTGYRSTMEMMEMSTDPVIFSHSNPKALYQHDRNITDDQIKACAATGGVIGINGLGTFMSGNMRDVSAALFVKHVDYVAQLVGPDHVGLGMDYVHDLEPLYVHNEQFPETWPPEMGYGDPNDWSFMPPESLPTVVEGLVQHGYAESEIRSILGENWLRVMRQVWK
ncbi:MAG: membrane dipeptidase [Deltaproteobacteria bacterium]|nr:membrane dipeptidase [Deltaproteobacteria bacterium]